MGDHLHDAGICDSLNSGTLQSRQDADGHRDNCVAEGDPVHGALLAKADIRGTRHAATIRTRRGERCLELSSNQRRDPSLEIEERMHFSLVGDLRWVQPTDKLRACEGDESRAGKSGSEAEQQAVRWPLYMAVDCIGHHDSTASDLVRCGILELRAATLAAQDFCVSSIVAQPQAGNIMEAPTASHIVLGQ